MIQIKKYLGGFIAMKKLFQPCRNKGEKGFTLIELLIVIAVLGVLAAVAVPNVMNFIKSGQLAAANSEAATVGTALQAYAAEHNGTYPGDSSTAEFTSFIGGSGLDSNSTYTFDPDTGTIIDASYASTDFTWNEALHKFERQ